METLGNVLRTTSIHGVKFVVNRNVHWTERIFWIICISLCWYGCGLLTIAAWDQFSNNPISFVIETTYKDWDTPFPAIAVCETENNDKIEEASDKLWSKDHDLNLEEILKEISFYKGLNYYLLQTCGEDNTNPNCIRGNFSYYAQLVRSSCNEIMENCTWMGEPLDCCKEFILIETELGPCYVINSIQVKKKKEINPISLISNRKTGPGYITMMINVPVNVYILGEEEVPTLTTLNSDILAVAGQAAYKRQVAIRSIANDEAAKDISWEQRRCRYPEEGLISSGLWNIPPVYPLHSYSACVVQCRRDAQIKLCNCSNFFMPNSRPEEHCNFDGMACIHSQFSMLTVVKAKWSERAGLYCNCPPSCTETDISTIADERIADIDRQSASVEIGLAFLPTERFRRNVVRTSLDLVVSVGSAAALFLGASILSFVEIFYVMIVATITGTIKMANEKMRPRKF